MAQVSGLQGVFRGDGIQLFGLDAELELKAQAKRNLVLEKELLTWISQVTGDPIENQNDISESLKSGISLCKLVNIVKPGTIKKFNTRRIPLLEMENIGFYLKACWHLGVPSNDLFVTSDLYLKKSVPSVVQNLLSFARLASSISSFPGPYFVQSKESLESASSANLFSMSEEIEKQRQIEEQNQKDKMGSDFSSLSASGSSTSSTSSTSSLPSYAFDIKEQYKAEKEKMEKQKIDLTNELESLKKNMQEKDSELEKLTAEVDSLKQKLKKEEQEQEKFKLEYEKKKKSQSDFFQKEIELLEKKKKDLIKEYETEKQETAKIQNQNTETELTFLQQQFEKKSKEQDEKLKKITDEFEKEFDVKSKKVSSLQKELETIKSKQIQTKKDLDQTKQKENELNSQFQNIKSKMTKESGEAESNRKKLENEITSKQNKLIEINNKLSQTNSELSQVNQKIQSKKQNSSQINQNLNQLSTKEKKLLQEKEKLLNESKSLNKDISTLKLEFDKFVSDNQKLIQDMEKNESVNKTNEIQEKEKQKEEFTKQFEELMKKERKKQNEQKEILISNYEKEISSIKKEIQDQQRKTSEIERDLTSIKKSNKEKEREIDRIEKEKEKERERERQKEKERTATNLMVSQEIERLTKELDELKAQLALKSKSVPSSSSLAELSKPQVVSSPGPVRTAPAPKSGGSKRTATIGSRRSTNINNMNQNDIIQNNKSSSDSKDQPQQKQGDDDTEVVVLEKRGKRRAITKHRPRSGRLTDTTAFSAMVEENATFAREVVSRILFSQPVDDEDVIKFNLMLKADEGRRAFVKVLKQTTKEVPNLVLREDSFDLLLFLVNTTIQNMTTSQSEDVFGLKIILFSALAISRGKVSGAQEYIKEFISSHPVWNDLKFWEEAFWEEMSKRYRDRKEEDPSIELDEDFIIQVMVSFAQMMYKWPVPEKTIKQFGSTIAQINKVSLPIYEERLSEALAEDLKMEARITNKATRAATKTFSRIIPCAKGHTFASISEVSKKPVVFCYECKKVIWGRGTSSAMCRVCGYAIHTKCRKGSFAK